MIFVIFLIIRLPPRANSIATLFPDTTLFLSESSAASASETARSQYADLSSRSSGSIAGPSQVAAQASQSSAAPAADHVTGASGSHTAGPSSQASGPAG